MRIHVRLFLLFFIFHCRIHAKFVIEPCNASDSCDALLSYITPWDSKLSEIASRFQLNVSDILVSNALDPTNSYIENKIIPAKSFIKVPISCPCVDGIRRSMSMYTVRASDTVESISAGYGGLVSAEQIRSVNGINSQNQLVNGENLIVPLPCTCFNNSNNGVPTVYLSYLVEGGESLSSIAGAYGTTVTDLEGINGLAQAVVDPGDILAIPIPACSSAYLNWYNESLLVPNGSYALTANDCIQCSCGLSDLNLRCFPSRLATSCSHLQCKGTNLLIGDVIEERAGTGCNVSTCLYRGHFGKKIYRSLVNSSQIQCSGNQSHFILPPSTSLPPHGSIIPSRRVFPSPSPSPVSPTNPSAPVVTSDPTSKHDTNNSSDVGSFRFASCLGLFVFQLVLRVSFDRVLET